MTNPSTILISHILEQVQDLRTRIQRLEGRAAPAPTPPRGRRRKGNVIPFPGRRP